jgi:hypothetical protein
MSEAVTEEQAQQTLEAVREQFAGHLYGGAGDPKLVDNRGRDFDERGPDWIIVGEFFDEWTLRVNSGEGGRAYDGIVIPASERWPSQVFGEPVNLCQLALYRQDQVR